MKSALIFLLAVSLAGAAFAEDDVLVVRNDPDVYRFGGDPNDGKRHGDGVATLVFKGTVVEEHGGRELPLPDVKFSVDPDRSFAHWSNDRVIFLSNTNGQFLSRLFVGAAMTVGGETPGRVYQTRRSKLRIQKAGYETAFLWFDYEMPEVKIIMRRTDTQQPVGGDSERRANAPSGTPQP